MSLLNQMLKDLEQRNAGAGGAKPLAADIRSVAIGGRSRPAVLWAAIVLLALLAAAFAIAWYKSTPRHTVQSVPLPAPAPMSAPIQAAPSAEVKQPIVEMAPQEAKPEPEPEPLKPAAGAVAAENPREAGSLREASSSENKSVSTEPSVPVPAREKTAAKPTTSLVKQISPQQRSDNLYRQAVALLQQGRVVEAQNLLEQALAGSPTNHNARQLLAGLLLDNKRTVDATALLQEGVKLSPEQTGFVMALARLQVDAGETQAGLQTMENALSYAGEDGEYQGFYAALLQRAGRHEEAVNHYLTALRTDPANTSWLVGVGISLQALAKFADAREAFERARQIGKLSPEVARFVEQRLAQLARQAK